MIKQFKLKDLNGLYLTHRPTVPVDSTNYLSQMFKDSDFFPKTNIDALGLSFKNAKYVDSGMIKGSNALSTSNSTLTHTEIYKPNRLIMNETYHNKFKFNFAFGGSSLFGYSPPGGISGTDFSNYLNRLRIKLYVQLGTNTIPLTLSNLEFWQSHLSTWIPISATTHYNVTTLSGFKLNTGLNGESCIDLGFDTTPGLGMDYGYTSYAAYFNDPFGPNGYNFRVDAEIPGFDKKVLDNKDYRLIVKYYNIGIAGTTLTHPYDTSEAVELMSTVYPYFQVLPTLLSDDVSYVGYGISTGGLGGGLGGGGIYTGGGGIYTGGGGGGGGIILSGGGG